jgi:hypothetical protein
MLGRTEVKGVDVLIDGKRIANMRLPRQGRFEISHVFSVKGDHTMQASISRTSGHPLETAKIELRVVDYREEIIALYNRFLERIADYGICARDEMTAREIEKFILRKGGFSQEGLRKITVSFEKAEYSNHLLARREYETMYLSLKEFHTSAEQET